MLLKGTCITCIFTYEHINFHMWTYSYSHAYIHAWEYLQWANKKNTEQWNMCGPWNVLKSICTVDLALGRSGSLVSPSFPCWYPGLSIEQIKFVLRPLYFGVRIFGQLKPMLGMCIKYRRWEAKLWSSFVITTSSGHGLSVYSTSTPVLYIMIHIIIPIIWKYVCKCTRSKDACMDLHCAGYSWKDIFNILDKWRTWKLSPNNKCQSQSSFQWW